MSSSIYDFVIDMETLMNPSLLAATLVTFKPVSKHLYINKFDYSNILTLAREQYIEGMNEVYSQADKWIKEDERWLTSKANGSLKLQNPLSSAYLLKTALDKGLVDFANVSDTNEGFLHFFGNLPQVDDRNRDLKMELNVANERYFSLRHLKTSFRYDGQPAMQQFARQLMEDSRIHVLGSAIVNKVNIVSSNKFFCDWLLKNDPMIEPIQPRRRFSDLEKAIKQDPGALTIDQVITIIENKEAFEAVNVILKNYGERKSLRDDLILFFLNQVLDTVGKPISVAFELGALVAKWRKQSLRNH